MMNSVYPVPQIKYKYFITYKKLGDCCPTKNDYKICFDKLQRNGKILYHVFEFDSMGKLHVHFIFESKESSLFKEKFTIKGYHKWIVSIYNDSVLWNYLQKEDRNWFRVNYAF